MLTARKVRFWYRVHKWTSLVCTAFLLMSCLTGLPLIFGDEILGFTGQHIHPKSLPANAPAANLDTILAAARGHYPKLKILSIGWDDDEPRIFVSLASSFRPKPHERHTLTFDAHTGMFLEELQPKTTILGTIAALHIDLYAGLPGELFLGAMAIVFVVALVSGAVVYGPFMRRLSFGTVRQARSTRLKWFDLHNLLGIVTLSWALVVGTTGVINTLSGPLFDAWRAQEVPTLLAPYRNRPALTHLASVDAAVHTVRQTLPQMEITSLLFPNDVFGSPRHYLIWTRGREPISSRLFTPVLIDADNGTLTSANGLPWYLRVLEMSRPLHFGDYGGMPLKIIWAFFDLALMAVLLSGLYLWLSRRKAPVENHLDRLVKLEELAAEAVPVGGMLS